MNEATNWLLDIGRRGMRIEVAEDGSLVPIDPNAVLSEADRQTLRKLEAEIRAILTSPAPQAAVIGNPANVRDCPGATVDDPHQIPTWRGYCLRCGWDEAD